MPPFLKHVEITGDEEMDILSSLSNWVKAAPNVRAATIQELEKMLVVELGTRKRVHVIDRIHGRICAVRKAQERVELIW